MFAFMVIKKAPALSSGGPVPLRLNLAAGCLHYSKTDAAGARGAEIWSFTIFDPPSATLPRSGFKHRGLGGEFAWRFCFAVLQQLLRPILFGWEHCPTVLAEVGARNFGLPTVLRFARFRVTGILVALIELMVSRETAQTAKGWPFFRASLTRSRSCGDLHQSTRCAWSHDHVMQAKSRRRATLG